MSLISREFAIINGVPSQSRKKDVGNDPFSALGAWLLNRDCKGKKGLREWRKPGRRLCQLKTEGLENSQVGREQIAPFDLDRAIGL